MKKNILVSALAALIFMFAAHTSFANDDIKVYYNGYEIYFDQPPVIQEGRTLVPMRKIFETIGARVEWEGETQSIYADYSGVSLVFQIGNTEYKKNCVYYTIDVAPVLINGYTFVPLRAVSENLFHDVEWVAEERAVMITANNTNGMLYNNDGTVKYMGGINNGVPHGAGSEYYADGSIKYLGNYENGVLNGDAFFCLADKSVEYVTTYVNGVANGECVIWNNLTGMAFIGKFQNGKFDASNKESKQFDSDGNCVYIGMLDENLKKNGQGIMLSEAYDYVGSFVDDELDGLVNIYTKQGTLFKTDYYVMGNEAGAYRQVFYDTAIDSLLNWREEELEKAYSNIDVDVDEIYATYGIRVDSNGTPTLINEPSYMDTYRNSSGGYWNSAISVIAGQSAVQDAWSLKQKADAYINQYVNHIASGEAYKIDVIVEEMIELFKTNILAATEQDFYYFTRYNRENNYLKDGDIDAMVRCILKEWYKR